jgi:hypothetical protein
MKHLDEIRGQERREQKPDTITSMKKEFKKIPLQHLSSNNNSDNVNSNSSIPKYANSFASGKFTMPSGKKKVIMEDSSDSDDEGV